MGFVIVHATWARGVVVDLPSQLAARWLHYRLTRPDGRVSAAPNVRRCNCPARLELSGRPPARADPDRGRILSAPTWPAAGTGARGTEAVVNDRLL
jgi:hypothetical protein